MNSTAKKIFGAAAGMTLLVPGATAFAATPDAAVDAASSDVQWTTVAPSGQTTEAADIAVASVEGTFSYDQNVITPNNCICEMFQRAVSALCQASFESAVVSADAATISVSWNGHEVVAATVDEMAGEDGDATIMGCACSGNIPGGGAIANAEVSGVSIASLADKVMGAVA